MATVSALKSGRVPNIERSEAMRARLLDATIDVIASDGWAKASTAKICQKAGVSRGAQTHHFPTRNDLMLAAVSENSKRYKRRIEEGEPALAESNGMFRNYLELLWDACFEEEFVQSWMEVMVAARTDAELVASVRKLDATAMKFMREATHAFAGEEHSTEHASDMVELSIILFRGMIIQNGVHRDLDHLRRLRGKWLDVVSRNLQIEQ